ncbi:hypothetical protein D3C72_758950 [compost metagenome]
MRADHEATYRQQPGHHHRHCCPTTLGKAVKQAPHIAQPFPFQLLTFLTQAARRRLGTDTPIRQQHWQQHQVGKDQDRHTNARGDGQVLDHRNVDQHQHRKTHGIGQQCGQSGQEQTTEGVTRGDQLMGAASDVLHDPVHFLRTVGHADGEHQKRHQNRKRVECITEQGDQAQLPDHRNHRA